MSTKVYPEGFEPGGTLDYERAKREAESLNKLGGADRIDTYGYAPGAMTGAQAMKKSIDALCQEADNSCAVGTPRQRMLNKQVVIANLQRQLQIKSDEVSRLHRAVTILTAHPEFDMFLELNHLLEGIKL